MHCPQCGQQQVTGEVRFCSRCGFPLGAVVELLANGGSLPVVTGEMETRRRSPRHEGVRQGVMMFFLGAVIVPLLGILNAFQGDDANLLDLLVPISAVLFFVGGFVRILYALIFEDGAPPAYPQSASLPYMPPMASTQLSAGVARGAAALPPAQSIPVSTWRQRSNTAEIVNPPSVTEHTTRLLDDPPDQTRR
jgi:hypothetical protein